MSRRRSGPPLLGPGTADTCPGCTHDHAQPTDWPRCPQHGHWLRGGQLTDDGFLYTCPAKYPTPCKHTHTQQEEATMTATNEAALAIRQGQDTWTPRQLAALRQIGAEDAPDGDLQVFLHYCQSTGLDPFAKQIRLRKDRQQVKDGDGQSHWENRWSIETEIDGYRLIAHRAAKRDGVELSYGPPVWFDGAGGEHKIWLGEDPPAGAARTVYKNGKPFPAVVRLKSFAKYTKDGQLQAMWAIMPDHLIAKCVEAQALRMAFPHDFEGISLSEEAAHQDNGAPGAVLTVQQIPEPTPPRRPQTPEARRSLLAGIRAQFDRIGLEDAEERKVYVAKLANKELGEELADSDLRFVLDSLSPDSCEDLAALIDLCAVEAS